MTLGTFLAFKSLSSHVTDPLLNFAGLWKQIQQVKLSNERLSEIFDSNMDESSGGSLIHNIKGKITINKLFFNFTQLKKAKI